MYYRPSFQSYRAGQTTGFITPDLTKQVVEFKQGRLKQVLVGNLDAKRDYTDVRDVVRAYRLLLEKGHPAKYTTSVQARLIAAMKY